MISKFYFDNFEEQGFISKDGSECYEILYIGDTLLIYHYLRFLEKYMGCIGFYDKAYRLTFIFFFFQN